MNPEWSIGDVVAYNDYGCTFTARLTKKGVFDMWTATVLTSEGSHINVGEIGVGTTVKVIKGHSVKISDAAPSDADLKRQLREANRRYGQASDTIGRLRGEVARLRARTGVLGDELAEYDSSTRKFRSTVPEGYSFHD